MDNLSRFWKQIIFVTVLVFSPYQVEAQESSQALDLPERISLPWRFLNISREFVAANKAALTDARKRWEQQMISQVETMNIHIRNSRKNTKEDLTENVKRVLAGVRVGKSGENLGINDSLSLEPALCPIGKYVIVFATLSSTKSRRLIAAGHHIIPYEKLQQENKEKRNSGGGLISEALISAGKRAIANGKKLAENKNDALQLSLRVGRKITRQDYGSSSCFNLLISESLAQNGFHLIRHLGLEMIDTIMHIYQPNSRHLRASRNILMMWGFKEKPYPSKGNFPLFLNLRAVYADAVFASPIDKLLLSEWQFNLGEEGELNYEMSEAFLKFLRQEELALNYSKQPKISKINRAWVYVDKGRAWGLKMKDRLVVRGKEKEIHGHVVGFFGPEENIKSPDGYPINEGAIIYIRKGQRKVQIGQELAYDKKKFPSTWPPKS